MIAFTFVGADITLRLAVADAAENNQLIRKESISILFSQTHVSSVFADTNDSSVNLPLSNMLSRRHAGPVG